jgi:diacylglycerol kinase (ATP)
VTLAAISNPSTVADPEDVRTEVKCRWPHDDILCFETEMKDPGVGQTQRALDEGVDVVLVAGGDGTVAQAVGVPAGTHVRTTIYHGRTATVSVDKPVAVEFDGDYAGEISELAVTVPLKALTLCTS